MTRMEKIAIAFAMLAATSVASLSARAQDYKIGYITDLSGPLAGSYTPTWQGFDLYIKALNDRGGVNGRKVAVTIDDDGLRADRAVAAAKKQVESNEVLGIFGLSLSSTQAPVVAEMQKVGVPVVSTFSAILDALPPAKPFYYSTGVMFEVAGEAIGVLQKQIAPSGKVVGMTFDSVGGRAALAHNKLTLEKEGYSWGDVIFPVRTADFTPFAQTAAAMQPAMVVGHYGAEQNIGVDRSAARDRLYRSLCGRGLRGVGRHGEAGGGASRQRRQPLHGVALCRAYRQRAGHGRPDRRREKIRHRQSDQHARHRLGARHVRRGSAEEMRRQLHAGIARQGDPGREARYQGSDRRPDRNVRRQSLRTDLLAALPLGKGETGRRRRLAQERPTSHSR